MRLRDNYCKRHNLPRHTFSTLSTLFSWSAYIFMIRIDLMEREKVICSILMDKAREDI